MIAYADMDHGGDRLAGDNKWRSGYAIRVDGTLVLWNSKKRALVAQSTMEAELIATAEAYRQIEWIGDIKEVEHRDRPGAPKIKKKTIA